MYCILCFCLCDFITAINLQINNLYYGLRCNKVSDSDSDSDSISQMNPYYAALYRQSFEKKVST